MNPIQPLSSALLMALALSTMLLSACGKDENGTPSAAGAVKPDSAQHDLISVQKCKPSQTAPGSGAVETPFSAAFSRQSDYLLEESTVYFASRSKDNLGVVKASSREILIVPFANPHLLDQTIRIQSICESDEARAAAEFNAAGGVEVRGDDNNVISTFSVKASSRAGRDLPLDYPDEASQTSLRNPTPPTFDGEGSEKAYVHADGRVEIWLHVKKTSPSDSREQVMMQLRYILRPTPRPAEIAANQLNDLSKLVRFGMNRETGLYLPTESAERFAKRAARHIFTTPGATVDSSIQAMTEVMNWSSGDSAGPSLTRSRSAYLMEAVALSPDPAQKLADLKSYYQYARTTLGYDRERAFKHALEQVELFIRGE